MTARWWMKLLGQSISRSLLLRLFPSSLRPPSPSVCFLLLSVPPPPSLCPRVGDNLGRELFDTLQEYRDRKVVDETTGQSISLSPHPLRLFHSFLPSSLSLPSISRSPSLSLHHPSLSLSQRVGDNTRRKPFDTVQKSRDRKEMDDTIDTAWSVLHSAS